MGYSVRAGAAFLLLVAVFGLSFLGVGKAIRRWLLSTSAKGGWLADLVLGFLAVPILLAVFSFLTGQALWVALLGLDCLALILLVFPLRARPAHPPEQQPDPLILPLEVSGWLGSTFLAIAFLVNAPYLTGILALPAGDHVDIESEIFDLQPAIGVTTSLAAYGFPPRHHSAPSVPLLYYTGYYVMPAAVAGLVPSQLISAVLVQYVFGVFVYLLVLWQLLCHAISIPAWRLGAFLLCLSGSTVGVFCWGWGFWFEDSFLHAFVQQSFHHETNVQFLLWMPRHAIPAILALLILEAFATGERMSGFLRSIFFPVVFLFASSLYTALFLIPALLVGLVWIWCAQWSRKTRGLACTPVRLTSLLCFVFFCALAILPHYSTAIQALGHGGAPVSRLTPDWFSPPVIGVVVLSCGLGLVVGFPVCFVSGRRGLLWLVYLLTLLLAVLTSGFNSDIMGKGTNILMVLVAFLSSLSLYRLWLAGKAGGFSARLGIGALVLVVTAWSLQSLAVGLDHPASLLPQTFTWRHRITRAEFELIRWVRKHTRADQTVSLVQEDRTTFEPLFGRPAFAAGPDAFCNGQSIWADACDLERHLQMNSDLLCGLAGSDFVFLSRQPMGFGHPRLLDSHFELHRKMIETLGFSIAMENEAGLIGVNPARTPEGKRALLAALPPMSFTNGYHSLLADSPKTVKWVQVDLGASVAIEAIRLVPARPTDFPDTPGFGFPVRFRVEVADEPTFAAPRIVADHTREDFPNPGDHVYCIPLHGEQARFIRVTATHLWNHDASYWFALAELEVTSNGTNLARNALVLALDSIEGGRWGCRYLVDGFDSRRQLSALTRADEKR
jgi:hypothetical protein